MIYPLVSWTVEVPTFTMDVLANGITETLTVPGGLYWGWRTTGAAVVPSPSQYYEADATSLAGLLRDVLNTHTQLGSVTTFYPASASGIGPGIYYADTLQADTEIVSTSNAAALALFGITAPLVLGGEGAITTRTAGVWRPKFAPPATLEPVTTAIGSGAVSEYNPATFSRLLFSGRLVWSVVWEFVPAADITRELALLNDYLPYADRATGDTAGTLDDLLWAVANGKQLALALPPIGSAAVEYRGCIINEQGEIPRDRYTTETGQGTRSYIVTLALLETDAYDPGTPL